MRSSTYLGRPGVTALPNGWSANYGGGTLSILSGRIATASGVVPAGTFVTIVSAIGAGSLKALMVAGAGGANKTMTLRITRDGVVIFNAATAAGVNGHFAAVGQVIPAGSAYALIDEEGIDYSESLLIEYTSSVAETNGANIYHRIQTRS